MIKESFNLKTLTPIWTGNINKKSDILRQTSIVGSLRYFAEAIIRGFDIYVCPIVLNVKKNDKDESLKKCIYKGNFKSLCLGCYILGTTNWQRQFRVFLNGNIQKINFQESNKNKYLVKEKGGIFGESPNIDIIWIDKGNLDFIPLNTFNTLDVLDTKDFLHLLMLVIKEFGYLGAKGRTGFGVVKIDNIDLDKVKNAVSSLDKLINNKIFRNENTDNQLYRKLSNINHFLRLDFTIESYEKLLKAFKSTFKYNNQLSLDIPNSLEHFYLYRPSGFYIKYFIRKRLKQNFRDIFGEEKKKGNKKPQQKTASFLYASHIYKENGKYKFRIIIEYFDSNLRNKLKEEVISLLQDNGCSFEKDYTFQKLKKEVLK